MTIIIGVVLMLILCLALIIRLPYYLQWWRGPSSWILLMSCYSVICFLMFCLGFLLGPGYSTVMAQFKPYLEHSPSHSAPTHSNNNPASSTP